MFNIKIAKLREELFYAIMDDNEELVTELENELFDYELLEVLDDEE